MEDVSSLFVGLTLMILFAVTSMRFGVDSRDGFRPRRGEIAPNGKIWDVPATTPRPQRTVRREDSRPVATPSD
jgi:hypothetical protein